MFDHFASDNRHAINMRVSFYTRLEATVLFCAALACCGYTRHADYTALSGPKPDYRRIIAHNLQQHSDLLKKNPEPTLLQPNTLGALEISGVRWVQHHTEGWVWLACLRAHPAGRAPIDFSFFIRENRVVDVRTSVMIDDCARQNYKSFALRPIRSHPMMHLRLVRNTNGAYDETSPIVRRPQ